MDQFEPLDIGDKVKHSKFGVGTVTQRFGETESQKVVVKFAAEYGEKKLVTKIANMKRISERPTLAANPAAPGTFPALPVAAALAATAGPAGKPPARPFNIQEAEAEAEDIEVEDEDDDDDDEGFGDDEGETGEEEEEE